MWRYGNPVDVRFGNGVFDRLGQLVSGRPYALVTYGEPVFDALAARAAHLAGTPAATIRNIGPNPDFRTLTQSCAALKSVGRVELIVAIGGGSVIDAAKVLAAAGDDFARVRTFLESGAGEDRLLALPIIAVAPLAGPG